MYQRSQGDRFGEIDEYGIAEWYPKCKVRKEGNIYIATPHTVNPVRRSIKKEKTIAVSEKDGKYSLKTDDLTAVEEVVEKEENGLQIAREKAVESDNKVLTTTHKEIFDKLYANYSELKPYERKKAIYNDMVGLFKSEEDAGYFVDEHWRRKRRNNYTRKQRFEYKAYNQAYEFFFTITYDDSKHTEESFESSLKNTFSNLHKRHNCLFQGVWERGKDNDRLHFHGLIFDPNRKILDGLEPVSDYNPKTGKVKTYLESKYFKDKFGRNEFSEIIPQMYDSAIRYITKYLSKQGVRPYYSKGLYRFIESDISGDDVICRMSDNESRDIRLIVAGDFKVWDEGELLGKASPEVIEQAPKLP